jgi:hypothetical protein
LPPLLSQISSQMCGTIGASSRTRFSTASETAARSNDFGSSPPSDSMNARVELTSSIVAATAVLKWNASKSAVTFLIV